VMEVWVVVAVAIGVLVDGGDGGCHSGGRG